MADYRCTSCGKSITNITGSTRFKCPKCSGSEIIRCADCRRFAAKYSCPECKFTGPN